MKHIILFFAAFSIAVIVDAQIVNIPDPNFKTLLIADPNINTNGDAEIQVSEAQVVTMLSIDHKNISDLTGIRSFTNLAYLDCSNNNLTSLNLNGLTHMGLLYISNNQITILHRSDFSALTDITCDNNPLTSVDLNALPGLQRVEITTCPQLTYLNVSNNPVLLNIFVPGNGLTTLNVSGCTALISMFCDHNKLQVLDLTGLVKLGNLDCSVNKIKELDVSSCPVMGSSGSITCQFDTALTSINLKNGEAGFVHTYIYGSPNLRYVCADEDDIIPLVNDFANQGMTNLSINSYCSFTPGGNYNTITGTIRIDNNNNGCDLADALFPNLKVKLNDASQDYYTTTNSNGIYNLYTYAGNFTVTPQLQNPYYTVTPASAIVNFASANGSTRTQNFCVTKNGTHNDAEITIVPETKAKPGFGAVYQIIYTNKGTETLSGNVKFDFDPAKLSFTIAYPSADNQSSGHLDWAYINLQPFESRTIRVYLTVEAPPINNINEVLELTAGIDPLLTDETAADNSFVLQQTIVGAFDPNDKACLEGAMIQSTKIGDYVHYLVRFQNVGTDTATNVVVKDLLTDKLDWTSLQFIKSSHPCTLKQSNGNKLEFIFNHINLPAKIQNDSASNGYVSFKIKSKSTLSAGDSLINDASIYFDYNVPVITNKAISKYINGVTVNLGNDINQCGGTATLNAGNAGSTYLWSTGAASQTLLVATSGTYWVRVTSTQGSSATDTININIKPVPVVNLGNDITQCGGSVTLNAGNAGSSYLWNTGALTQSINANSSGTYIAKVTNAAGCSAGDTIIVTINAQPVVNLGNDINQCGGSVTLNAANAGSSYLWNTNAATAVLQVNNSGTYWVKVTSGAGCIGRDTIQVTINSLPVVQLGNDSSICSGVSVLLDAGNPGSSYLWNNGNTNRTLAVNQAGSFAVKVTNSTGCSSSDTINIALRPKPILLFNIVDSLYTNDPAIVLNASPAGGQFSGPAVANGHFDPSIAGAGLHTLQYSYTDNFGCSATVSKNILVKPFMNEVRIYPNPNRGSFNVLLPNGLHDTKMEIVTASGIVIMKQTIASGQQNFKLSLPAGIYYLKLSNTGFLQTKRMIIW